MTAASARGFAVGIAILALAALPAAGSPDGIGWLTEIGGALERSRESARPVMVDVWAVWCAPCKLMDETTYRDPSVVAASRGLVPLKIDADVHGELLEQRYRIDAYPTVLFLDHAGDEITRLEGRVRAPRLLRTMELVGAGYPAWLAARARQATPEQLVQASSYLAAVENPGGAAELLRRAIKSAGLPAGDESRQRLELGIAEAQLADDAARAAGKTFARLAEEGASAAIRARALAGLARSQRARGREDQALRTLQALRERFPEEAAVLPPAE